MISSNDWRVAIVVNPALTAGLMANTVAVIAIGIGAAYPNLAGDVLTDIKNRSYHISANCSVPILQAEHSLIQWLFLKSLPSPEQAAVVPFPAFARSIHSYEDYASQVPTRDLAVELTLTH